MRLRIGAPIFRFRTAAEANQGAQFVRCHALRQSGRSYISSVDPVMIYYVESRQIHI